MPYIDKIQVSNVNYDVRDSSAVMTVDGQEPDQYGNVNVGKAYVAEDFSVQENYAIGDYTIYNQELYKFVAGHTAGAWDENDVENVTVTEEISDISKDNATNIDKTNADIGIVEKGNTATHTITSGQYVIWKGDLYKAKTAIPSGTTLSTTNLEACSNGGLNSLADHIGTVPSGKTLQGQITDISNLVQLPQSTKTTKKDFTGSGNFTYILVLTDPAMVTVTAYNGGTINLYGGDISIMSAYAPSGWTQSSCGNSLPLKAGTYAVYYNGATSNSSAKVIVWS